MKTKLLWITSIACNGNAHSFLNYPYIEQFLKDFEFVYHPILPSSNNLKEIIEDDIKCDVLILEGAISLEYKKFDEPVINLIDKYGTKAKKIVTVGTCATFGGLFRKSSYAHITGFLFDKDKPTYLFNSLKNKTICISGCPVQPQVLVDILYSIRDNIKLKLDEFLRPIEYFAYTVHNGCTRNEYFEYKVDNHDFGKKEGCMFYDHGCKAPYTRGSCNKILWNEVNSKTRNGSPCFGCTEPNFPKTNLFKTKKNMGIPENLPLGVAKRVYLTLAGVTKAFKIKRLEEDLF
jgi:hydrogenase small subunit